MSLHKFIRPLQLSAVLTSLFLCVNCAAGDWALADLMQLLAQQKSGKASFVEKKFIGVLDKPLESSGELSFDAPDRLEKRTLKPRAEIMLLEGDKLSITPYEKRAINLRLQDHPEIAALVESIRGTLSGDKVSIEKNYSVDLTGVQGKWQLSLVPLQKEVAKVVRQIRIGGSDANIKRITFEQVDGDRFEMTISKFIVP